MKHNMQRVISDIRDFAKARWMLGWVHGVSHWDRVYENGMRLITPEVNPTVVGLFAL